MSPTGATAGFDHAEMRANGSTKFLRHPTNAN